MSFLPVFGAAKISPAIKSKDFKETSNCFEAMLQVIRILTSIIGSGRVLLRGGTALLFREVPIRQVIHVLAASIWSIKDLSCHGIKRLQGDFELLRSNTPSNTQLLRAAGPFSAAAGHSSHISYL